MDRPLDPEFITSKKRYRIIRLVIIGGAVIGLYFLISGLITPSISRTDVRFAKVYSGVFEATLSASGTVLPEFEEVLTSPVETRVIAVQKRPGEHLSRGTQVLQLDMSELQLALSRTERDLTLKSNARTQAILEGERTTAGLKSQLNIKTLRLTYAQSKTAQSVKMFDIGAISRDQYDQTKMDEQIATIDHDDMEKDLHTSEATIKNQIEGLSAEVSTMQKERDEIRRELEILSCRASREGILNWVLQDIGTAVHKGDPVAKIADLSGFRIDASISDVNATRIAVGQPARIKINEDYLEGTITAIYPTVENGVVRFTIGLKEKASALLRPNLKVDVFVILSGKTKSLLVEKGPFMTGEREQPVFVLRGDKAIRVMAGIGSASFDRVELSSGLTEGDEMIISDMKDYHHLRELRLK